MIKNEIKNNNNKCKNKECKVQLYRVFMTSTQMSLGSGPRVC